LNVNSSSRSGCASIKFHISRDGKEENSQNVSAIQQRLFLFSTEKRNVPSSISRRKWLQLFSRFIFLPDINEATRRGKKILQDGKIFGNDDKQTQSVLRSLVTGLQQQHKQLTVYI
jgi:hypothetical protein